MILTSVLVVLLALLFSAFFSGMEIAFISSNKLKLEIEKSRSPLFSYIAGLFSRHSGQYITTILVGNNIALVIYSLQMSILIHLLLDLFGRKGYFDGAEPDDGAGGAQISAEMQHGQPGQPY